MPHYPTFYSATKMVSAPLIVAERMRDVMPASVESALDNFIYYASSSITFSGFLPVVFSAVRPMSTVTITAIIVTTTV